MSLIKKGCGHDAHASAFFRHECRNADTTLPAVARDEHGARLSVTLSGAAVVLDEKGVLGGDAKEGS